MTTKKARRSAMTLLFMTERLAHFFFVTLEEILKLSVFARSLRNSAIFEVTIENLLTSVFCLNLRIERTLDVEPPACFNGSLSGAKVHIFVETDTALSFKLKTN